MNLVKMRAKRMIIIQIIGAAHLSKVLWFWQCWYLEQWQARVRQISKVLWDSLLRLPARATSHMIPNISNMILNHIFSSFIMHIPYTIYHYTMCHKSKVSLEFLKRFSTKVASLMIFKDDNHGAGWRYIFFWHPWYKRYHPWCTW